MSNRTGCVGLANYCPDRLASYDVSARPHLRATIAWSGNMGHLVLATFYHLIVYVAAYCIDGLSPSYCLYYVYRAQQARGERSLRFFRLLTAAPSPLTETMLSDL